MKSVRFMFFCAALAVCLTGLLRYALPAVAGRQAPPQTLYGAAGDEFGAAVTIMAESSGGTGGRTNTPNITCPSITLNPPTLPLGSPGQSYSQTITATGGAAPYSFGVPPGQLPQGLSLSAGGVISGTTTSVGGFGVSITATDANGCRKTQEYLLTINVPPTLTPLSVNATQGGLASRQTIASVQDNQFTDTLSYSINGGASATVNGVTVSNLSATRFNVLSADVVAICAATNASFTLAVTDDFGVTVSATLTVTVAPNSAPVLSYANQTVAVGGALQINPTGGPSDNGSVASMTVQSAGTFTGTVNVNNLTGVVNVSNARPGGTHTLTIRATDNCGATRNATITLTVSCPTITINPTTLPIGNVGQSYSQTLTANGGVGPYQFAHTAGALPAGLSLAANGVLSGTTTAAGVFAFTAQATDANGCVGTGTLTLRSNAPPTITTVGLTVRQGDPTAQLQVGAVSELGEPVTAVTVTVNGGASATVNGVTLSGLNVNASGFVRANVMATCMATQASFTLTATDSAGATSTVTLNVTVTANPAPTLSYANQSVAAGSTLTINPATGPSDNGSVASMTVQSAGTFTGTVNVNNLTGVVNVSNARPGGTHTLTIRVTDNCGATRDASFTLSVGCPTLSLAPMSLPNATTGTPYSQTLSATGGNAPYSFSVNAGSTLPNGLTLTSAGSLSGTPTTSGNPTFTLKVTDANGCQGTLSYTLTINCAAIAINPATLPGGTAGAAYSQTLTQTGGLGAVTFSVNGGALPAGVLLSAAGVLAGTPTAVGTFNFTARVTDANNCAGERAYALVIACPAINVNPATIPAGAAGTAYSQTFTQTGGAGTVAFALTGALPTGLAFNGTTLSGTPTQTGSFPLTLTATDVNGCAGRRDYTLIVNAATCPTLTVNPATLPSGTMGTVYTQSITASGGAAFYSYAVTSGALPNNLSLSNAGALTGAPTVSGTFNFTITATDANGCTGARPYTFTVDSGGCPTLTLNPATLPNGTVGEAYSQQLTATGGSAPYSFSMASGTLPGGVSLSNAGTLSGTPTAPGAANFTVQATDANGCQGTRSYTLSVGGGTTGLQFYPLAQPVRLLDTRPGATGCDAPGNAITGGTARTQTAAGRSCGGLTIPADARALTGNITTVASGGGYLTLYPSDAAQPVVANTNYGPNEILNNVFTVGLGAAGAFNIFALNHTHVVVDVTGYYAPPSTTGLYFHPLPKPVRLLDTRAGAQACFTPGAPLLQGSNTPQLGQTACDGVTIPASARALVGNATTVNPQSGGYLTLYPADAQQPLVASSNYTAGQVMNAPFTVGLAPSGFFNLFTTAQADLVLDVLGYYSTEAHDANGVGLLFNPLAAPVRLLETRAGEAGCFTPGAPMLGGTAYTQAAVGACTGIPAAAQALVGNATVVNAQAGYLTFWPSAAAQPLVATSNYLTGQIFNRHFTVGLGTDGAFKRFAAAQTDLVIDVTGFFAP